MKCIFVIIYKDSCGCWLKYTNRKDLHMFGPGTFFGDLITIIAGNKLYLVITTAICTALVLPLIKYIVQNIWEGLKKTRSCK